MKTFLIFEDVFVDYINVFFAESQVMSAKERDEFVFYEIGIAKYVRTVERQMSFMGIDRAEYPPALFTCMLTIFT